MKGFLRPTLLRLSALVSLRLRIVITFAMICSLGVYHLTDWLSGQTRRPYLEAAEELMVDQALLLRPQFYDRQGVLDLAAGTGLLQHGTQSSQAAMQARIYGVVKGGSDAAFYVTDAQGRVLWHSAGLDVGADYGRWKNVTSALRGAYGARSTRADPQDPDSSVLHITLPLHADAQGGAVAGTLSVVKPVRSLGVYLAQARERLLYRSLLTLLLVLVLGYVLMQRITGPLQRLTDYVSRLRDGYRPALPPLPPGELELLGRTVEELSLRLEGKEYVEQYVQTLTHELKAPLAAIAGAVELLPPTQDPQQERLQANISRECQRMTAMVEHLLTLARLENQSAGEEQRPLDPALLLRSWVDELRERFAPRELTLELPPPGGARILAEPEQLRCCLDNLVLNAHEFAPAHSPVAIRLEAAAGRLLLSVSDHGPGIPEYARSRVLERFYSLPRPGTGRKSSGLGLCIVSRIMAMQGGELRLEDNHPGVRAILAWPLLAEGAQS